MTQMHDSGVKDWMSDDVSFMDVISYRLLASRPACGISLLSTHAAAITGCSGEQCFAGSAG